jgi:hypothetical protein
LLESLKITGRVRPTLLIHRVQALLKIFREVVPDLVELEVAVPRLSPAVR